jgi:hypothetical protein
MYISFLQLTVGPDSPPAFERWRRDISLFPQTHHSFHRDARELLDAQRGEMLDDVDRMADDARDRELAGRQLRSARRFSFTLVSHCGP